MNKSIGLILFAVFTCIKGIAQNLDSNTFSDTIILKEIVLSSSKFNDSKEKVAQANTQLNKESIENSNAQTSADLINTTGAVFIQKSQLGGGSPMIRGYAANRLLISVDGVRMNNAIFRNGNLQNIISIDPFSLEKVEVLFGPASVIHGSDAIGGVMNFRTLDTRLGTDSSNYFSANLVPRYSSANQEQTIHADFSLGFKKIGFITSFSHNTFGDLRMGKNGPDEYLSKQYAQSFDGIDSAVVNKDPRVQHNSDYSTNFFLQKIKYKASNNWEFNNIIIYSTTSDIPRYDRLIQNKANGQPKYGEFYYGPQVWLMNTISAINRPKNNKLFDQLIIQGAYQYFEESRVSRNFKSDKHSTRTEAVDVFSMNVDFRKLFNKFEIDYGLESIFNDVNSTGSEYKLSTKTETKGASRYPKSNWSSQAIYINSKYDLNKSMLLTTGLRYNIVNLNAAFDTTFYPFPFTQTSYLKQSITESISWIYKVNKKLLLSALFNTGFRAPNVDDLGKVFDSAPGLVVVPNVNIKAEYVYNFEVNITKQFGDKLALTSSCYYNFLNNALVRRDFTLNGQDSIVYDGTLSKVQAIQNAAHITVIGFHLGGTLKLHKNLKLSSTLNVQKGQEELDNGNYSTLRHAAPNFGQSNLIYRYKKLTFSLNSEYSGAKKASQMPEEEIAKSYLYIADKNGAPYSPSWITFNSKITYELRHQIKLFFGCNNITNLRYRPYSSGLAAPGRNFVISVSSRF